MSKLHASVAYTIIIIEWSLNKTYGITKSLQYIVRIGL